LGSGSPHPGAHRWPRGKDRFGNLVVAGLAEKFESGGLDGLRLIGLEGGLEEGGELVEGGGFQRLNCSLAFGSRFLSVHCKCDCLRLQILDILDKSGTLTKAL